jgi:hypothetical protein
MRLHALRCLLRRGWHAPGGPGPTKRPALIRAHSRVRLPLRILAAAVGLGLAAAAAIGAAIEITPMQTVKIAGQVIEVGVTPRPSLSGPAEIELFGQDLPTAGAIPGPMRPVLQLTQITLDSELANFVQGAKPSTATQDLRARLVSGWEHYFAWETCIAVLLALTLAGAVAGWRRMSRGRTVRLLALVAGGALVINLGLIAVTAYGARHALQHVHSLSQLVASKPIAPAEASRAGPPVRGIQLVVMGDSTAAGAGLRPVSHPSRADRACGRSSQAYAEDLARTDGWKAVNLACDSATIPHGLLGGQQRGGRQLAAQMAAARRVQHPSVVIVSIGADDLRWSAILEFCAIARRCDNRASAAYFKQKLAEFSANYLKLLIGLGQLPGSPKIIINSYYNPFGKDITCMTKRGLTAAKARTLSTWLAALNSVLSNGAKQFGYLSVRPSFAGHQLCSAVPYVQGLRGKAPFHPTALGQLAIALADQAALTR